jgi:hypothetical protein
LIALESRKFPSVAYLRQMGIINFKPTFRHKVQIGHKIFNIMDDPRIALVSSRVKCRWDCGGPPRFDRNMAKNLKDLEYGTQNDLKGLLPNNLYSPKSQTMTGRTYKLKKTRSARKKKL